MSRRSLHYHLHQWSPRISHLCICPSPSTHCSSVTNCKQKYFTLFNPKANKKWATLDLDSDRCNWIHNHNGGLGLEIMMVLKIGKLWWFWQFRNGFFYFDRHSDCLRLSVAEITIFTSPVRALSVTIIMMIKFIITIILTVSPELLMGQYPMHCNDNITNTCCCRTPVSIS